MASAEKETHLVKKVMKKAIKEKENLTDKQKAVMTKAISVIKALKAAVKAKEAACDTEKEADEPLKSVPTLDLKKLLKKHATSKLAVQEEEQEEQPKEKESEAQEEVE